MRRRNMSESMSATERQRRWRDRIRKGAMAVTVDIDARVIDELVRRGFLERDDEVYSREQIQAAVQEWLMVSARYG
jgi:hypothetical protein